MKYVVLKAFKDYDDRVKVPGQLISVNEDRASRLISKGYILPLPEAEREGFFEAIQGVADNLLRSVEGSAINKNAGNYGSVTIDFDALTTGAIGAHKILEVDGLVRLRFLIECTTDLEGAGATIELGVNSDTDGFIATTTATDIDAGVMWKDDSPAETHGDFGSILFDKVINAEDLEYEVKVADITAGTLKIHYWWEALNDDGAVTVA